MFVELNCISSDGNELKVNVKQTCGGEQGVEVFWNRQQPPLSECRVSDPSWGFCHLTVAGRTLRRRKLPQPWTAASVADCGG